MTLSAVHILNLVSRYAECIDSGNLEGAAELLRHARIKTANGIVGHEEVLQMWRDFIVIYEDGTPRTKHLVTNPVIDVDEEAGRGSCRTYYTVMQQVGDGPLQPIICGRYHDEFERINGEWRFCYRDYSLHDMPGDMSGHSRSGGWPLRNNGV